MLTYFLAPTRETPPDTSIRLGNIVERPRFADQPLNEDPLPIDKVTVNPEARRAKFSFGNTKTTTIGIWATFLMQILGVGGDVNTQISRGITETWDCDTVKTISFEPSTAYIKNSVEATAVKQYIQARRHRPWDTKLYMITGIKIAYGAKGTISYARSKGIHLHLGVDATSLGAPMQAGPDIGVEKGRNMTQDIGDRDPFVLGFRIQRIKVSTKGQVRQKRVDGDMLGVDDDFEDEERVELVIDGLEDADADAEEFGIKSSWTVDGEGDGNVTCALVEDD